MQFLDFRQQLTDYIVFSINDVKKIYPDFNWMNLVAWQKKDYIQKLRNGWYRFSDRKTDESVLFYIANKIYSPSYVSFETALSYYSLIPEAVFTISSVSTLKTEKFKNDAGSFTYATIKPSCFFGYELVQKNTFSFKIASIEKTLLDYFYIHTSVKTFEDIAALRLNKAILTEQIKIPKLDDYSRLFDSKSLDKRIILLKKYLYA